MKQTPLIKHLRAFTLRGGGADYHDQADGHGIDDHIATPISKNPSYRQSRRSFGINVLGTLVVCWRHDARQRPPHWTGQPVDRPACRILPFRRLVDWEREGWCR